MALALVSFFAAFLLFVVQPMLAKWLLPSVGGSPATWAACMLLYQLLLLAGYAYAHVTSSRLSPRSQARLHVIVLVTAALSLFVAPPAGAPKLAPITPALAIPWLLLQRIGLPFFALSATTPLCSRWAALEARRSPHSLYAVSNAGSLLGLLAYPFALEPAFGLERQQTLWATGFWLTALGLVAVAARVGEAKRGSAAAAGASTWATRFRWLAWAFVPSELLLAATNHITVDIAATPLLWVLPLALYLGSFVLAFGAWRPSWRGPLLGVFLASAFLLGVNAYAGAAAPLWRQLGATLTAFFAASVLCHGELANARPPPAELTGYWVVVASGGALGGVFVGLVAPFVFRDYYELELGVLATFALLLSFTRIGLGRAARMALLLGSGVCIPLIASALLARGESSTQHARVVDRSRSFLGPLKVLDLEAGRMLTHGRIQHGFELRDPKLANAPTLYFGPDTLLGRALSRYHTDRPRRIGIIGLGAGTLATYGKKGDRIRFYELDPEVVALARKDFGFLAASAAQSEVVLGDGRLELAREPPHAFDVLVLDAFSSDSVPVHLMTHEAFAVYIRQLAPDGLLLANVSNRYLSVDRVVSASAKSVGLACAFAQSAPDPARHLVLAEWALCARDRRALEAFTDGVSLRTPDSDVDWTDEHASLWSIVRWRRR